MKTTNCPYGFRIVGDCTNPRLVVDSGRAFAAYAACDERAQPDRESYLSAFNFGENFRALPLNQSVRPDKDPKYYLAQSPLKFVPMTELQAMRVNAELGAKKDGLGWLSPRQKELLVAIQKSPDAGWPVALGAEDIVVAWDRAQKIAGRTR